MRKTILPPLFALFLVACDRREEEEKPAAPAGPPGGAATQPAPVPAARLAEGSEVYRKACMLCHDKGVANAPALANRQEWATRAAKGKETLYRNAIKGFTGTRGFMPPKGGNPGAWTDEQVKSAVDYMVHAAQQP